MKKIVFLLVASLVFNMMSPAIMAEAFSEEMVTEAVGRVSETIENVENASEEIVVEETGEVSEIIENDSEELAMETFGEVSAQEKILSSKEEVVRYLPFKKNNMVEGRRTKEVTNVLFFGY